MSRRVAVVGQEHQDCVRSSGRNLLAQLCKALILAHIFERYSPLQFGSFPPDGFIDETSPQSVVLRDQSGESIWITQSRNRLNYEIHTNIFRASVR